MPRGKTFLNHNGKRLVLSEFSYWRDTEDEEHYRIKYGKHISEAPTLREAISGLLKKLK